MSDTIFVLIAWFIIRKNSYSTYIVINPFFITKISQWNGFARMADEYTSDLAAVNYIGVSQTRIQNFGTATKHYKRQTS